MSLDKTCLNTCGTFILSLDKTCLNICRTFMTSQYLSLSGNTMGVTSGARSANPSGAPEFIPSLSVVRSLIFGVVFCRSLFVFVPLAIVLSLLFLLTAFDHPIVLSVLLLFTAFDPFGILKHFLRQTIMVDVNVHLCFFHFNISLCFWENLWDVIDQYNCVLEHFIYPFSSIDEYIHKGCYTLNDKYIM